MGKKELKIVMVGSDPMFVVINAGKREGIELNSKYMIYSQVNIIDPDTKECLGKITQDKMLVKVYSVEEKFSLARLFEADFSRELVKPGDFVREI